jgi:hypothetical protein
VPHFIPNDAAKLCIDLLFVLTVTDTAEVEVRAVTDVATVLIGPANKAMELICNLHGGIKSWLRNLGNRLRDLSFLIVAGIIAFTAAHRDDSRPLRVHKLPVRAFLPVEDIAGLAQVRKQLSHFAGHGGVQ